MKTRARRSLLKITPLALVLLAATAAWACTAVPSVSMGLRSGPAGMHIPLDGTGFAPAAVEIRWNSPEGPIVGGAMGPDFSTSFAAPQAEPGIYYVVAIQTAPDGTIMKASDTFELTAVSDIPGTGGSPGQSRSGSASTSGLWEGFSGPASSPGGEAAADASSRDLSPALLMGLGLVAVGAGALAAGVVASGRAKRRRTTV